MAELLNSWSLVSKNFEWQDNAACRGQGELFFFERGNNTKNTIMAKEICNSCPVRKDCLDFAITNRFEYGIWGGKTPKERLLILGIHSWNDNDPR